MNAQLIQSIIDGNPAITLSVNAADLRNIILSIVQGERIMMQLNVYLLKCVIWELMKLLETQDVKMEMLFLFLILNSNSMINESGFMPDFLFSVNRYYDIIETNLTQI